MSSNFQVHLLLSEVGAVESWRQQHAAAMRAADVNEMATALCEFWRRAIFVFTDATPDAKAWLAADENWQSLLALFDLAAGEILGAMESSNHGEYGFENTPAQIAAIQRSARKAVQNGFWLPEKVKIDLSHLIESAE